MVEVTVTLGAAGELFENLGRFSLVFEYLDRDFEGPSRGVFCLNSEEYQAQSCWVQLLVVSDVGLYVIGLEFY